MRKLSTNETWDYTKRMWKWIAFRKDTMLDTRSVLELKRVWLRENAPEFVGIEKDCFFCEEAGGCSQCHKCPGRAVDSGFNCQGHDNPHQYQNHPGAFCREILRLDEIRTAKPVVVEHVWKHGDVFETKTGGTVMVHLILHNGPVVYVLDYSGPGEGTVSYCLKDATFLFNIKTVIKDKL